MKRFHVHVSVQDLDSSIRFYSTVFGVAPAVHKSDYAKWMLDDPRLNFAISQRGHALGVNHLGFQLDTDEELKAMRRGVVEGELAALDQANAACCYAKSDKYWLTDPQGVAWETFHTLESVPMFGDDHIPAAQPDPVPCCAPQQAEAGPAKPTASGCCA
jgi:catechol 2,3-dioxygenase-like lactoylglutathione lyase family enzyme